jgi:hypothetical protein
MPHHWRARLLFSAALLLAVSAIFPQTVAGQINGLDIKGDENPGEGLGPTDASATQVSDPLPIASAPLEVPSELVATANSAAVPGTAPALPSPQGSRDSNWHVSISPYLWFGGVHGTVGALNHEASVHASFADLLSHFNFGLMFAVEPRYKRIVMPLDFMWMKLSDDKQLAFDAGATSVNAVVNQDILTQKIGYSLIDGERLKVDGVVGFRYWHSGNTLTVQFPQIAPRFYASGNWVDAVGGGRIQAILSPKVSLTVLGDAGGGGANVDYQIAGFIGWKLKKCTLLGGWRYLSVNYRPGGELIYDMTTSGLFMGVTIPLK